MGLVWRKAPSWFVRAISPLPSATVLPRGSLSSSQRIEIVSSANCHHFSHPQAVYNALLLARRSLHIDQIDLANLTRRKIRKRDRLRRHAHLHNASSMGVCFSRKGSPQPAGVAPAVGMQPPAMPNEVATWMSRTLSIGDGIDVRQLDDGVLLCRLLDVVLHQVPNFHLKMH